MRVRCIVIKTRTNLLVFKCFIRTDIFDLVSDKDDNKNKIPIYFNKYHKHN